MGRYPGGREVYDSSPHIGNNIFLSWPMLFHNLVCGPPAKDVTWPPWSGPPHITLGGLPCIVYCVCGGPSDREVS
jgi:hypothetical protein